MGERGREEEEKRAGGRSRRRIGGSTLLQGSALMTVSTGPTNLQCDEQQDTPQCSWKQVFLKHC